MEIPKEYIEQCEKAVEIQELWEPEEGDFILNISATPLPPAKHFIYVNYLQQPFCNSPHWELITTMKRTFLIWLPRIDQLQKMCINYLKKDGYCMNLVFKLNDFYTHSLVLFNKCTTMEQVWLMIVMKEKFNKSWDSVKKDWILDK